jgi:hypothetical protein
MIRTYESIAALREEALSLGAVKHSDRSYGFDYNTVGETTEETLRYSLTGNTSLVPEAEALIDKLDAQIETPRRVWERSPAGAFCVVPDVLAGLPTYMRYQREVGDERQAISIFVRPNASYGVTAAILRKRGITILALAMALARVRPISLHYFFVSEGTRERDGCKEDVLDARIETAPLDLATACYALSSAGFYRRMCFGLVEKSGGLVGALISLRRSEEICYNLLGNDSKLTLVIGPAELNDPLLTQPVVWLNKQIARFVNSGEGQD